jgi:dihydrodipicolinate synthase/N-acetylneuraminate lyase
MKPAPAPLLPPIRPRRAIQGMSAVLLPFTADGAIDVAGWTALLERTWNAGLIPAINMDTGHAHAITADARADLLRRAGALARGRGFVAGVVAEPGSGALLPRLAKPLAAIVASGGTSILFQTPELSAMARSGARHDLLDTYRQCAAIAPGMLAFELGTMFAPWGAIYDLDTVRGLMDIPGIAGMKHSSLDREQEWARLILRDAHRPDFRVCTGNDLAIDLVMWGSDYLLGLSAFHVEAFAARDALWAAGDPLFHTLNDWLQHLGMLAFRDPVPAYKHTCAQVLHLRGLIADDAQPAGARRRRDDDRELLRPIIARLDELTAEAHRRLASHAA